MGKLTLSKNREANIVRCREQIDLNENYHAQENHLHFGEIIYCALVEAPIFWQNNCLAL